MNRTAHRPVDGTAGTVLISPPRSIGCLQSMPRSQDAGARGELKPRREEVSLRSPQWGALLVDEGTRPSKVFNKPTDCCAAHNTSAIPIPLHVALGSQSARRPRPGAPYRLYRGVTAALWGTQVPVSLQYAVHSRAIRCSSLRIQVCPWDWESYVHLDRQDAWMYQSGKYATPVSMLPGSTEN